MSDELQRVIEAKLWAENDRLHAEVKRMKKELGEGGMSYSDGVERDRLFIENGQLRAEVERLKKELDEARAAVPIAYNRAFREAIAALEEKTR